MKLTFTLLFSLFLIFDSFANINLIDISKISSDSQFVSDFNYIKENQQFYDHWTNEWTYIKSKKELITNLREKFNSFSSIENKNTELFLLLGDISHYLYNLDDSASFRNAVNNYNSAIKESPNDYRCYWFLGYHYALANVPTQAIDNFLKAQELLPTEESTHFWNDFALTSLLTNMPSHSIYAMDKVKSISGIQGSFETQFGQNIRNRIIPVDKNKSYKKEDIWTANLGEISMLTCRPLGIKIVLDSSWNLSVYDYENRQSAFLIHPPALKSKKW